MICRIQPDEKRARRHSYGWRDGRPLFRGATYKSHESARRSFYKWVCKHELYGQLNICLCHHVYRPEITYFRHERDPAKYNYGGVGFSRGYPSWEASRSEARKQWEMDFERHKDRWDDIERANRRARIDGIDRLIVGTNPKVRHVFKVLAAVGAIK